MFPMKKLLWIFPLVVLFIWRTSANSLTNISLDFCATTKGTLTYHINAGTETGICYTIANHAEVPVTIKLWFIDGTFTNDQQQNKACLSDTDRENFWKYVTGYDQLITLKVGETVKKEAKIMYATGMNWLYRGCVVYSIVGKPVNISGFSIIMRSARFIDVFVGTPKTIQGTWIILESFSHADGENISQDSKIRIYKDTADDGYVIQMKIRNISSVEQDIVITWNISNILSYKEQFVEARKILSGELLVITKKLGKIPPYNLKIQLAINNMPFAFDIKQEPVIWTIKEETVIWKWNVAGYIILAGIILFMAILLTQDKKKRKRENIHHIHTHHIHDQHNNHQHKAHHGIVHKHPHKEK